mmetsp:Transcript_11554/g.23708  ORF Transcript_11554/g.23708 Transcript_11554/m.23708 type:complete len:612 (+) Transcript_11554:234-2069(+)
MATQVIPVGGDGEGLIEKDMEVIAQDVLTELNSSKKAIHTVGSSPGNNKTSSSESRFSQPKRSSTRSARSARSARGTRSPRQTLTRSVSAVPVRISEIAKDVTVILEKRKVFKKVESYGTAIMSITDMITDIIMISRFYASGRSHFANMTLIAVCTNLGIQSIITYIVNHKKSYQVQLKEQLIVISLMKPGVDIYRTMQLDTKKEKLKKLMEERTKVMSEAKLKGDRDEEEKKKDLESSEVVDARFMMTSGRAIEMCTEAVPGTVIQMSAFLSIRDGTALFSLLMSASAAAFMSAVISYEYDTDPFHRVHHFYGYIPNNMWSKVLVFTQLFLLSFFCLFVRAASFALLSLKGALTPALFIGAEFALYILIKAARKDYMYWVHVEGAKRHLATFLVRLIVKTIVDFVACVQFRHPLEAGGLCFSSSLLVTFLLGLFSAHTYEKKSEEDWDKAIVWTGMGLACGGLAISFAWLLLSIERPHVKSFFSLTKGSEHVCKIFKESKDMKSKMETFSYREELWRPFIEDEVRDWLNTVALPKLVLSLAHTPWFDDYHKSIIPDDMVDDPSMLARIRGKKVEELKKARRRSSLGALVTARRQSIANALDNAAEDGNGG